MAPPALSIEGDRVRVPLAAFDHAGFRAWVTSADFPERIRASYVAGEVLVEMSPESIETHNKVKTEVTVTLGYLIREADLGVLYTDGALLTNDRASLSTEPDLVFASWDTLQSGRLRFVPKSNREEDSVELVGTPDLVVEIVSDSSVRKDLVLLRDAYARAGVPEYWVIDARKDPLRFEILLLDHDLYAAREPAGGPQRSALFGRRYSLAKERDRVGGSRYRLTSG
jgi:Uma2 family endonuclease